MKQKLQIKPTKPVAAAQMIACGILTIVGLTVVIPLLSKDRGGVWFGILWTGIGFVGAIIGAINALSERGIPMEEIVSTPADPPVPKSTEERLRELDDLRERKLISENEYTETRKRVLDEH